MLLEDPERICDECRKNSSSCQWLKMKARSACTRCTDKRIKCKIDGIPVSNHAQRQMGPSLSKRRHMTYDDSGNSGDGERDHGGSEDSEVIQKGTGVVGNGSHAGGFGTGAGVDTGVNGTTGRAPGGVGFPYQGHRGCDGPVSARGAFHEGLRDGKAGRAGRD